MWIALAVLVAFALAVYLPFAAQGNLYTDDYAFLVDAEFYPRSSGRLLVDALRELLSGGYRSIGSALLQVIPNAHAGSAPWPLVPSLLVAGLQSALLFTVLRTLGMRPAYAGAGAALILVGPTVDTSRLWPAAFIAGLAPTLWVAGLLAALLGLKASGRRRLLLHGLAALLYALAISTYESTAPLVALSWLAYLAIAGPTRPVLKRAVVDVAVAAVVLGRGIEEARARGSDDSLEYMWNHGKTVAANLLDSTIYLLPGDRLLTGPLGVVLAAAALVGIGMALARPGRSAQAIRRWGLAGLLAGVYTAAGAVLLIPASAAFDPMAHGTANRFASASGPGQVVLVVAFLALVAIGLASLVNRPRLAAPLALGALLLTVATNGVRELRNQDAWHAAAEEQEDVLRSVDRALGGRPPAGTAVATVGHRGITPHGVPVFLTAWDLQGALQLRYHDRSLRAHPPQAPMACADRALVYPPGGGPAVGRLSSDELSFRRLYVVDAASATAVRVRGRKACEAVLAGASGTPAPKANPPPWKRLDL